MCMCMRIVVVVAQAGYDDMDVTKHVFYKDEQKYDITLIAVTCATLVVFMLGLLYLCKIRKTMQSLHKKKVQSFKLQEPSDVKLQMNS